MLGWLLVGCQTSPLSEVPIEGIDPDTSDAIRAHLEAFEAAVGPGRVELRAVRVVSHERFEARYNPTTRTLAVAARALSSSTLRSGLCNALFAQDDLDETIRAAPYPVDALVELPYAAEQMIPMPTPERRRNMAVAAMCGEGPYWAADLVRDVCPRLESIEEDPGLTDAAAAWMMDEVWSAFELPDPLELDAAVQAAPDLLAAPPAAIVGTTDPGVIRIETGDGTFVWASLYDGQPVTTTPDPVPHDPSLPAGLGMWVSGDEDRAGWPSGPGILDGVWLNPLLNTHQSRILAHDTETWRFVGDGCAEGSRWVFAADDRVWLARWESASPFEGTLSWASVPAP